MSSSRDEPPQPRAQGASGPGTHQVTPALLFALTVASFLDICKVPVPQPSDFPERLFLTSLKIIPQSLSHPFIIPFMDLTNI